MKRWTIRLKVTLWFTLFMTLLSVLALGILVYSSEYSALENIKFRITDVVEQVQRDVEWKDNELEIDKDLEGFQDGVYVSTNFDLDYGDIIVFRIHRRRGILHTCPSRLACRGVSVRQSAVAPSQRSCGR